MADYVVSTWDEFLQHNTSGDTVKFSNPHEVNGEIVLSGTGTQADPYIVSTYEEMLFATGATYIWEVKLINREQKLYRYEDIYCRYDDSLSTIDFNLIQPEGYNTNLEINAAVDGNGWTWKNIVLNDTTLTFNSDAEAVKNLKITNFLARSSNTGGVISVSSKGISDSILDIRMDSLNYNSAVPVLKTNNTGGASAKNSSIYITIRGGDSSLSGTTTNYVLNFENSAVDLDIDATNFYIGHRTSSSAHGGSSFTNVLVTGDIKTTSDVSIGDNVTNSIFDVAYSGEGKLVSSSSTVRAASFYNSDKVEDETGLAVTNMTGATTVDLKSAQYLYEHGLPIAVE